MCVSICVHHKVGIDIPGHYDQIWLTIFSLRSEDDYRKNILSKRRGMTNYYYLLHKAQPMRSYRAASAGFLRSCMWVCMGVCECVSVCALMSFPGCVGDKLRYRQSSLSCGRVRALMNMEGPGWGLRALAALFSHMAATGPFCIWSAVLLWSDWCAKRLTL